MTKVHGVAGRTAASVEKERFAFLIQVKNAVKFAFFLRR